MPPKKIGQKDVVTSLRINPELWKMAKIEAVKQGITLGELVDKSLRKELGVNQKEVKKLE